MANKNISFRPSDRVNNYIDETLKANPEMTITVLINMLLANNIKDGFVVAGDGTK